ncbi:DUF1850 domain-containing protein [Paracoccus zeaxanthinifaciens]|uniref:DUF1850 domain-containing protein n=1 Tax=Paracoccus zeaxanthinifaciens TaxID=187400 RepID=UPI0003B3A65F|nr:DUF1850 domain-containing protein [Paracoccus zeaxanthinifaciens]
MICVAAGAAVLTLAAPGFTLEWTHSVERTRWWERWQATEAGLAPVEARITGSGAGMEPAPDAVLRDGAWWWEPDTPPVAQVLLGASGATGGGWRLCAAGECHDLPEGERPIRLWQAQDCTAP